MKVNSLLIKKCVMHFKLLLYGASLLICTNLQAQVAVTGTVISSEDNAGIPGVNVVVSGSGTGTTQILMESTN